MAAKTLIKVDINENPKNQPTSLHNRWHPDIPSVASVNPGDTFRVECMDCSGGQIKNDDGLSDLFGVDLASVHYLSGPIEVTGAEPGDLLVVDILAVGTLKGSEWGWTCIIPKAGFLEEHFPNAVKAIWNFDGDHATSRQVPGTESNMSHFLTKNICFS